MEKKLSICIPTYRKKKLILALLDEIFRQLHEFDSSDIEVVISVNPSEEKIHELIKKVYSSETFKLNVNEVNIGAVKNTLKTIELACGKMIWVIGDDDYVVPGLIYKVILALREYPDISWLYINSARLEGDAADSDVKLVEAYSNMIKDKGYYSDGRSKLIELFRKIDARILFSTSNIYRREAAIKVHKFGYAEKYKSEHDIYFQLTGTFYSANLGGAYIIPEASIIEGESTSWTDTSYFITVHAINDAVYAAKDWGYTEKQVKNLIRHRMMDDALVVWTVIFRKVFKDPKHGLEDFKKYLTYFPFLSICIIAFFWIWIPYLAIRRIYRKMVRINSLKKLRRKSGLPKCIVERL